MNMEELCIPRQVGPFLEGMENYIALPIFNLKKIALSLPYDPTPMYTNWYSASTIPKRTVE